MQVIFYELPEACYDQHHECHLVTAFHSVDPLQRSVEI